jgi:hypothetical protein
VWKTENRDGKGIEMKGETESGKKKGKERAQ